MSHEFNNAGTVQYGQAKAHAAVQRLPNIEGSVYPWWFKFHPFRWQVLPDGRVVPQLGKLKGEPGVGGVSKDGDTSWARAKAADKGWTVLPWNVLGEDYIRTVETSRGTVYLPRWADVKILGNRAIITPNLEAFWDWSARLMDEGIVPYPDPSILDGMADAQRQRMETVLARVGDQSARGKAEIERLEVIEEAAAAPEEATVPKREVKPKRQRAPRKRTPRKTPAKS
jgi:hypothetical protein